MYKILIVDDDDVVREALRRGFSKKNYELAEASEGEEAVEVALKFEPDVIILDMMMPKLGGLEACERMREDLKLDKTPIIFLSTSEQDWDILSSYTKGGSAYLVKPLDFDATFFEKLNGMVEGYLSKEG